LEFSQKTTSKLHKVV